MTVLVDLPVVEVLDDGSYLSVLGDVIARQRYRRHVRAGRGDAVLEGCPVRVVEYRVADRDGDGEVYRLITTILDPQDASARELAAAYHERWEFELTLAEIETYQRGPGRTLRSKSPEMVRQEIWALLTTHYGIRRLMARAADQARMDPDRLSFTRALRVVRRHTTDQGAFPPHHLKRAIGLALEEILARPNPPRRHRTCPRTVKRHRLSRHRITRPDDQPLTHAGPPTLEILRR